MTIGIYTRKSEPTTVCADTWLVVTENCSQLAVGRRFEVLCPD